MKAYTRLVVVLLTFVLTACQSPGSLGSAEAPFPFQQPAEVTLGTGAERGTFDFVVAEVIRGDLANQIVKSANIFNEDPPPGMEYAIIKIGATLKEGKIDLSLANVNVVSKGNLFDSMSSMAFGTDSMGYPDFQANLVLPGASAEA